ncbi:MAG: patatin-like phospholipase family protein [Polyangiaceae bacterium]
MAIVIGGAEKRIGLALSGGGFRAAAFHLGVFRKLDALGLLDKIDLFSCVSGGSIVGAALVAGWKQRAAALEKLDDYLRTRSIAVASVMGGLLDPFASRTDKLADSYDRDLFDGTTLGALDDGPRLYLNATSLATGNLFFFVTGARLGAELGDHELGDAQDATKFRLSRAVAASSSFPPVFPPLRLADGEFSPTKLVEYVTLTDGGVYDNLGVNPLLRVERNRLDYAIVSDAGSPFAVDEQPTEASFGVLFSIIQILMEQVRGLQFDRLQHRHAAGLGPKPLWFSIDSEEGEARAGDAERASRVGTNLKRLTASEMEVLTRHSGALLERRLRDYAPELLAPG